MKKIFIFLVVAILAVAFFLQKEWQPFSKQTEESFSFPINEQKPFVILIPSYNNSKYIEKNLHSVFSQNYENFRVIYIDDSSSDDTLDKATTFFKQFDPQRKATLIHNPVNYGALANIYNAVSRCQDSEIIVLLSGDDFLSHENVLQILNQAYANPNTWTTYSQMLDYPSYLEPSYKAKRLPQKTNLRASRWVTTRLHSFYASLFKQIKIKDLYYRGRFYPMGWEHAVMLPILEMASSHITYIPEVLYLNNRSNPLSDFKINPSFQKECISHIRSKEPYLPLKWLPNRSAQDTQTADLVIFSHDHPLQLYALLESIEVYVKGLGKISVIYQSSGPEIETAYLDLKKNFPAIQFTQQTTHFKALFEKSIFESLSESPYILFAEDTLMIKDWIDLPLAIKSLEQTGAYGVYFGNHQKLGFSRQLQRYQAVPVFTPITGNAAEETLFAWQFSFGTDDWNCPNSLDFALYRKEDLQEIFRPLDYTSPETLLCQWGLATSQENIGLLYNNSKCIHISLLEPDQTLLEKFQEGLKIDLAPFFQISSPSQEISFKPDFISRSEQKNELNSFFP